MKITLNELSGSLGDLGTYLPLVIVLAKLNLININTTLFFSGMLNILTAVVWDIPMPVQPMKSIASVAITENNLTQEQITTSGILVGGIILLLGLTKTIDILNKLISKSVISGIQLGLGLKMAIKGIDYINSSEYLVEKIIGIILCILTFISFNLYRFPSALLLVIISSVYSLSILDYSNIKYSFIIPIDVETLKGITKEDWYYGFINGALPQVPLTILNSVISVCALSKTLFPENEKVTRRSVAISVGLMNIITCPLGGLPVCHGAGGLAGQYKFGARNGFSILFLGINKVILSLALGNILIIILSSFPDFILGILLFFSGIELATKGLLNSNDNITLITSAVQMSTDTFIGTMFGIVISMIQLFIDNYNIIKLRIIRI